MQISITEDEIKAIDFGLEQIREALEGSSSDDYKKCADEAINKLESILRKYHLAREKANELNEAKDISVQETDICHLQSWIKWQDC